MFGTFKKAGAILGTLLLVVAFQNCGKGFQSSHSLGVTTSPSVDPGIVPLQAPGPGISNADFTTCYGLNSNNPTALATCMNSKPNSANVYTSTQITTCINNGYSASQNLAFCLSKNAQVIQDYRTPKQTDIEACVASSPTDVSFCLAEKGVRSGVTNDQLTQCTTASGALGVELCLHKRGNIATFPTAFQDDVDMCMNTGGGTSAIALCLFNADLVPATVTQASVDACVTAAGESGVIKCLRSKYYLPKALMQTDVDRCNAAVGQSKIATCLANQGLLMIDTTVAANVTAYQTNIDNCVTAAGEAGVVKCLRKNGFLPTSIMQAQIVSCFDTVGGGNVFACLGKNFPVLPAKLTQTALDTCFAANSGTPANAAKCLSTAGILPTAASEDNILQCNFYVGQSPNTTVNPGQFGIAACLTNNGLLPTGVTQAMIDGCVTSNGLDNVNVCLNNSGAMPSFAVLTSATGLLKTTCASCHNAGNKTANLDIEDYTTVLGKVVPGDSANSVLYTDVKSGNMPKGGTAYTAAQVAIIKAWIDQGANNN